MRRDGDRFLYAFQTAPPTGQEINSGRTLTFAKTPVGAGATPFADPSKQVVKLLLSLSLSLSQRRPTYSSTKYSSSNSLGVAVRVRHTLVDSSIAQLL